MNLARSVLAGVLIALGVKATYLQASTIDVQVLGTIHKLHLNQQFNYTLSDLQNQILAIKPEIVCGEISAKHADAPLAGYYPPENVVIKHAAMAVSAEFLPSDWRGDYRDMVAAEEAMTSEEQSQFDHAHDTLLAALPIGTDRLFAFLHEDAQPLIQSAHDIRIRMGTEIADGYWLARNQAIVKNCMRHVVARGYTKVLFTYGVEHKYIIESYLRDQYAINAQSIVKQFEPSNHRVGDAIIAEWRTQLYNLESLLNDVNTPDFEKDMIRASNRVEDLKEFIRTMGVAQAQ